MADTNDLSSYYETKFSGLFQKAPIGMLLLKGSGQIEFVNPYAEKLFGNSNTVFVGLTVYTRIIAKEIGRYREILLRSPEAKINCENILQESFHKDGLIVLVHSSMLCIKKDDRMEMTAFVN